MPTRSVRPLDDIPGKLDHVVRAKFQNLLDASYRPFPFAELPIELALRILGYAASCSQGTYRSLLLTNKRMAGLVRIEMLSGVSVILTSERQMKAFKFYLRACPEVIPHIHALWTVTPGSVRQISTLCVDIITTCTSLRALACHPHILLQSICQQTTLAHTLLVDLTMIEFRVPWSLLMNYGGSRTGAELFNQLERLHFIGALDTNHWAVFPKLNNISRVSIAMGSHRRITADLFQELVASPKLLQVVITTRLHGEAQQTLSSAAQDIDDRFSVLHRRRRWKEANLWNESLQDPDRFWNQAKEEKYLPPAPRPAVH
ncbi:hypothetical protein DFH07DRAFT_965380 [Mycena maculata]|uniref:Uncharacterized protein n=1 Tax=Mycena maculata TaxID=230809 RepID=A0AAD7MZR1_9AGAR|nr:hypothetical protein DFH07DRAFT_965380 [Mycena maculata]